MIETSGAKGRSGQAKVVGSPTGWLPGEIIVDEHVLSLPDDAPPGDYALIAGMYDESTLQRLAVLDASGGWSFDVDDERARRIERRLPEMGLGFVIEPRVRFRGQAGEQATFFLRDPAGNALEFKAFADPSRLFARD